MRSIFMKDKTIEYMLIFAIAIISRVLFLGAYPVGVHADEAYAGYEAYAMLKYGTDSWGYTNPVYLTTWGSGMSALESYLMIPFIAIGGLNTITIRIPQVIIGIITVFVFWLLVKEITDEKMAFWAALLIAICPWHIMMSRWGLDANLAPGFILLGMYFGVLGLKNEKWLVISAVFWGLSLYCYALVWIFVPAFLLLSSLYCIKYGKIKINRYSILSAVILGILALPLLLFVAVNVGFIPEIKSQYISIPRLIQFRNDELTQFNFFKNLKDFLTIYVKQNDGSLMHVSPYFGLYYLFTAPFILIGVYECIKNTVKNIRNRRFGYEAFLLFWLVICTAIGLLRSMSVYRANCMNLAVLLLAVMGINAVCGKINREAVTKSVIVTYVISFFIFEIYYFTGYQQSISRIQMEGAEDAIAYALELRDENNIDKIHITNQLRHSQVLFYQAYPTDAFRENVVWRNYPAKWVYADSFGYFVWDMDNINTLEGIYVLSCDEVEEYENAGYTIKQFDSCAVAVYQK